jgi:hypothetical protein
VKTDLIDSHSCPVLMRAHGSGHLRGRRHDGFDLGYFRALNSRSQHGTTSFPLLDDGHLSFGSDSFLKKGAFMTTWMNR